MDRDEVTFIETLGHLGGVWAFVGVVVLLAGLYVALVEWVLPRGRAQRTQQEMRTRRALKLKKRK